MRLGAEFDSDHILSVADWADTGESNININAKIKAVVRWTNPSNIYFMGSGLDIIVYKKTGYRRNPPDGSPPR